MALGIKEVRKIMHLVSYTDKKFYPYMIALGQVISAWNESHQALSGLYSQLMGGGFVNQLVATFDTIDSDRTKRKVLFTALETTATIKDDLRGSFIRKEIDWTLKALTSLEDKRNDFAHSPVYALRNENKPLLILPEGSIGHPRSRKLQKLLDEKKNLITEMRIYRDDMITLSEHILYITACLGGESVPLPSRPKLLFRQETKPQKDRPQVRSK